MEPILRVFQVFLAIGLIGVVLLQRSEGGGLGIGSSGGMGSFMSVRGTANFLTRVTGILAALFMITCLALALLAKPREAPASLFSNPMPAAPVVPAAPPAEAPAATPPAAAPETRSVEPASPAAVPAPAVVPPTASPATASPAPAGPAPEAAAPAPAPTASTPAKPQAAAKPKKTPAHPAGQ
jgi:preprotein translocase subunit SecG